MAAVLFKVKALWEFRALDDTQISFSEDDLISVVEEDESGWNTGFLGGDSAKTGLFPANFTERMYVFFIRFLYMKTPPFSSKIPLEISLQISLELLSKIPKKLSRGRWILIVFLKNNARF
jgi:hypothetical protein